MSAAAAAASATAADLLAAQERLGGLQQQLEHSEVRGPSGPLSPGHAPAGAQVSEGG